MIGGHSSYNKWTKEEDALLREAVALYGEGGRWSQVAACIPNRTPIQCSTRWTGALNSSIHKGKWAAEEDRLLLRGYWAEIGRLVRAIKGFPPMQHHVNQERADEEAAGFALSVEPEIIEEIEEKISWSSIADSVPGRTAVQCIARYQEALDPSIKKGKWSQDEDVVLKEGMMKYGKCWVKIAAMVRGRTQRQCRTRWLQMRHKLDRESGASGGSNGEMFE